MGRLLSATPIGAEGTGTGKAKEKQRPWTADCATGNASS